MPWHAAYFHYKTFHRKSELKEILLSFGVSICQDQTTSNVVFMQL